MLSASDLRRHKTLWQEPLVAQAFSYRIATAPPNSWGLALLLQLMQLDGRASRHAPIADEVRAWRSAVSQAENLIADPEQTESISRAMLANPGQSTPVIAEPFVAAPAAKGGDTTGVLAMDRQGNAVSLIQSVFNPFGAGILEESTGIILNNRLSGFVLDDGHVNQLAPFKRPAHTLVPAMVLDGASPYMAIATPGATGQGCTLAQVLIRHLKEGMSLPDAISAPRWSVAGNDEIILESSLDEKSKSIALEAIKRAKIVPGGSHTMGSVKAVARDGDGFIGVADYRRSASASGC